LIGSCKVYINIFGIRPISKTRNLYNDAFYVDGTVEGSDLNTSLKNVWINIPDELINATHIRSSLDTYHYWRHMEVGMSKRYNSQGRHGIEY
jgi:hypothetical protein